MSLTYFPAGTSTVGRHAPAGLTASHPGGLLQAATGAWAARQVLGGRYLRDLSGNGRHMRAGGVGSAYTDGQALVQPGVSGNYASVPDSAALDAITGDLDLRAKVAPDAWTGSTQYLIGKVANSTGGFGLRVESSGVLMLLWADGSALKTKVSTVAVPFAAGATGWVRATLDVNNGASGHDVTFYTSSDGVAWTQLGSVVTTAGTTSIAPENNVCALGAGTSTFTNVMTGKLFRAQVLDGIGGTTVLDVDFAAAGVGGFGRTFVCDTGQTVTVSGAATTNDPKVLPCTGTRYLYLPGATGNYASVPDSAALDITGDIDLRADVALDDWSNSTQDLIGKWRSGTGQGSYVLRVDPSGKLIMLWSNDGSASLSQTSSAVVPVSDGGRIQVRATLDVDNGASGHDVKFYTRAAGYGLSDGSGWTQLGTTATGVGTTSVYAGSETLTIGALNNTAGNSPTGSIYRATIKDGIGGTTVLDVDFTDAGQFPSGGASTSGTASNIGGMLLDGVTGSYASVPDSAALGVVGDLDVRADVALDGWTSASQSFVSKDDVGSNRSYQFLLVSGGPLQMRWSTDGAGTGVETVNSTVSPTVSDGGRLQVRATLDVDNGASGYDVKFYTRAAGTDLTDDTGWTQLGSTVTGGATTSLFSGTAPLDLGRRQNDTWELSGKFYAAVVKDGIGGTTVLDVDFSSADSTPTFTADTGQTVTLNGNATVGLQTVTIVRSSSGRKAVYVEKPTLLLGTDDFLSIADHADFDVGASDDLTVVAVGRFFGTPPSTASIWASKTNGIGAANTGWFLGTNNTPNPRANVSDGTSTVNAQGPVLSAGARTTLSFVLDRTVDTLTARPDGASPVSTAAIGAITSADDTTIGRAGTLYNDVEIFGVAVFVGRVLTAAQIAQVGRELGA